MATQFTNSDIRALRFVIELLQDMQSKCYNSVTQKNLKMMINQLIKTRILITDSVMQKDFFAMRDHKLVDGYESELEKVG